MEDGEEGGGGGGVGEGDAKLGCSYQCSLLVSAIIRKTKSVRHSVTARWGVTRYAPVSVTTRRLCDADSCHGPPSETLTAGTRLTLIGNTTRRLSSAKYPSLNASLNDHYHCVLARFDSSTFVTTAGPL